MSLFSLLNVITKFNNFPTYPKFCWYATGTTHIFHLGLKNIFATVKKSRLGYDLPTSVNDRVISPFRQGLILTKLRMPEFTVSGTFNGKI